MYVYVKLFKQFELIFPLVKCAEWICDFANSRHLYDMFHSSALTRLVATVLTYTPDESVAIYS